MKATALVIAADIGDEFLELFCNRSGTIFDTISQCDDDFFFLEPSLLEKNEI
eukprot:Awhi_evm1s12637